VARTPKGRAKPTGSLRRGQPTRERYERILIVCEGEKTEPNYFDEIRQEARIPTLHIRILHSQEGTQPLQVVHSAEEEFKKTKQFEKVFAVFDRDDHTTYANAIARAESLNGKLKNDEGKQVLFKAIVSVPCFELWLLLHYANIQSYFHRREILHQLRTHIINYEKGQDGIYKLTKENLRVATERAQYLKKHFSRIPGDEAYTDVDEIVGILRAIRSSNR
jgi:RloB-like protein